MSYGLSRDGFKRKQYADIWNEMVSRAQSLWGEDVNLTEQSPLGIFCRLNAWELARVWQVAEANYYSWAIDYAEGHTLDMVVHNIGLERRPAEKATGYATFTGQTSGIKIPEDLIISTADGVKFRVSEWGWISGSTGIVPIEAVEAGIGGNVQPNTIIKIVSNSELATVYNHVATENGRNIETDAELRERYKRSVQNPGQATVGAIEAALLALPGVRDAYVRENDTQDAIEIEPDVFIFPKTIYALVEGGDAQQIADTIHDVKAGGIQSWATDTQGVIMQAEDSRGYEHMIGFDRPRLVNIQAEIEVELSSEYEEGDFADIETAVRNYIDGLKIGQRLVYHKILALAQLNKGVKDVEEVYLRQQAMVELVSDAGGRLEIHAAPLPGQLGVDGDGITVDIVDSTVTGSATYNGTTTTLEDDAKTWIENEHIGKWLEMTFGPNDTQRGRIVGNTVDTVTVMLDHAFGEAVSEFDTYKIYEGLNISYTPTTLTIDLSGEMATATEIMHALQDIEEIDAFVFHEGIFDPAEDTTSETLAGGSTVETNIVIGIREIAKCGTVTIREAD